MAFFISCTLVRIVACTLLGIYYIVDVVTWKPDAQLGSGAWVCVSLSLLAYWIILILSWYWYIKDVLAEVHKEFKQAFGAEYLKCWRKCMPKSAVGSTSATSSRVMNNA